MDIAFFAPLKPPGHPVPSGDRLMARLLIACLTRAGHSVTVASDMRCYLRDAGDEKGLRALQQMAEGERNRLAELWQHTGAPDLWFCYHPYYKAPDLLGPPLCAVRGIPYVTAEASYSARRNIGLWAGLQDGVRKSVSHAAVNICMTERDRQGLLLSVPGARTARLRPFIDVPSAPHNPEPFHLVTVAMMRSGDKMQSYVHLAAALARLPDLRWTLSIVGDGPLRAEVEALFAGFPPQRLVWHGQLEPEAISALFERCAVYVWPGCGEAYGLAYLEAQAAGLPVVAFETAGVPEVVAAGETGLLAPDGDDAAYAAAIAELLTDNARLKMMSDAARMRVQRDHSIAGAAVAMAQILNIHLGPQAI